jgi:hypothetical protein
MMIAACVGISATDLSGNSRCGESLSILNSCDVRRTTLWHFWIRNFARQAEAPLSPADNLAFARDPKGERDTNNFIRVPATGQVNRL